ncbi:MAG: hypothetical protein ACLR78_04375 [Roseburia sp.]
MIVPHIRNHAHIGLQNAMLRTTLIFGLQCHALDHQNFRILAAARRRMPTCSLILAFASAAQRLFIAGNIYRHRIRTCSFAEYPQSACPQSGLDQPTDRRFPSCAVYMHHVTQGCSGFAASRPLSKVPGTRKALEKNRNLKHKTPLDFIVQKNHFLKSYSETTQNSTDKYEKMLLLPNCIIALGKRSILY